MHDVRDAVRVLRRDPGYAALAILTMALGIGATTTLFSVAYGVLMKPLPFPHSDRIVRVTESRKGQQGRIRGTISNGAYLAWRDAASTVVLGGYGIVGNAMTVLPRQASEPVRLQIGRMTSSLFDVLQTRPVRGRAFSPDDEVAGSGTPPPPKVVILSYALWQDWFGGRDDVIGSIIRIDDLPVTVIGVMPRGFSFPDRETRAWLPMPIGSVLGDNGMWRIMVFGALARLQPGVTPLQASAEGSARARTAPDPGFAALGMFGSSAPPDISVTSAADAMTADVRPAIVLLLAAVVLLLVTATANVGGLQLARATTRRRELAVRAAIGASGVQLVRWVVVESAVVGLAGGTAGVALTMALHRGLPAFLPADFPRLDEVAVNAPVLAFAVIVSVGASIACALLPSLAATDVRLADALVEETSRATAGLWRSPSGWLRSIVMAAQVAVACLLLVGAALLARSFVALVRADRGYDPTNVLTARVDLPRRYQPGQRAAFYDAVLARLQGAPGLTHVAAGNALPLLTQGDVFSKEMPSPSDPSIKEQIRANFRMVSPEYFGAMRLRLLEGRLLAETDGATSPSVVVVDRSFVQRYLGAVHLGVHIPIKFAETGSDAEIVGVVDDMRQSDVTDPPVPEMFVSYRQVPTWLARGATIFIIRTVDDPLRHVSALRDAVREQDPDVALDSIMTMDERVATSLAKPRLYALLLSGFAIAALAIAGVGLFGVLSYTVAQRVREIGIRTALGAQVHDIVTLVLKHAMITTVAGIGLGLWAAHALTPYVSSFLYGVSSADVLSYTMVALVVAAVAMTACVVPARRAARVDPIIALRAE